MNLIALIEAKLTYFVSFLATLPASSLAITHHVTCAMFREYLGFTWGLLATLPIPDSLLYPTLTIPSPLVYAVHQLGLPQAMAIIAAAFTLKLTMRLLPFAFGGI